MTEGDYWYREFFLHEGKLLNGYPDYLKKTFRPGASPGVHLIFVAPREGLGAPEFAALCHRLAEELRRLSHPEAQDAPAI